MKTVLNLLVQALLALPLLAVSVSTRPLAPTSHDPIEIQMGVICGLQSAQVTRQGQTIRIEYEDYGAVCSPPIVTLGVVKLEPLPPGVYSIQVFAKGREDLVGAMRFTVRDAASPFRLYPSVVDAPEDAPERRVQLVRADGSPVCPSGGCSDLKVRVGGSEVAARVESDGRVSFLPPTHATGAVDVEVQRGETREVAVAALAYTDHFDPSLYERVLFPVLDFVQGAGGSQWRSEVVIANPKPWPVSLLRRIVPAVCVVEPCFDRVEPGSSLRFDGADYPNGVALPVPRGDADQLSFSLRARDVSRSAVGLGTRVPVVRERDMMRGEAVALLNVPRDPMYRVKVRFYALAPFFEEIPTGTLVIVDQKTGLRSEQRVAFTRPEDNPDEVDPAYAEVDPAYAEVDFDGGSAGQRMSLYLDPPMGALAWGFATVTNNTTQEVTVVTPSGKADVPCDRPACQ